MNTQNLFLICFLVVITTAEQPSSDSISCISEKSVTLTDRFLSSASIAAAFLMLSASSLANAGGMGGSSIILSINLLLFKFNAYSSISNTLLFVCLGSATAIFLQLKKNYASKSPSRLSYDSILLMTGPLALGSRLGVFLNPLLPESILLAMIVFIVAFSFKSILKKAMIAYSMSMDQEITPALLSDSPKRNFGLTSFIRLLMDKKKKSQAWQRFEGEVTAEPEILETEEDRWEDIGLVALSVFVAMAANFYLTFVVLKERNVPMGVAVYVAMMVLMTVFSGRYVWNKSEKKKWNGGAVWSLRNCVLTCGISGVVGLTIGLLGTGGGNIINPLMVALGLPVETAALTHSFCVHVSSSITVLLYFLQSDLEISACLYFGCISVIGCFIGIHYLRKYFLRNDQMHWLLFTLSFLLFTSIVIISIAPIQAVYTILR